MATAVLLRPPHGGARVHLGHCCDEWQGLSHRGSAVVAAHHPAPGGAFPGWGIPGGIYVPSRLRPPALAGAPAAGPSITACRRLPRWMAADRPGLILWTSGIYYGCRGCRVEKSILAGRQLGGWPGHGGPAHPPPPARVPPHASPPGPPCPVGPLQPRRGGVGGRGSPIAVLPSAPAGPGAHCRFASCPPEPGADK